MNGYVLFPTGIVVQNYDEPQEITHSMSVYAYLSQLVESVVVKNNWIPFTFAQVNVPDVSVYPFAPGISLATDGLFLFNTPLTTIGSKDFEHWYTKRYINYTFFLKDLARVRTEAVQVCFEYMLHKTGEWE